MSSAIVTTGTVIKRGNGASPEVFTAIAEVVDIDPPSAVAGEIDVSHLASVAKEFRAGLRDFGSGTLTVNLIPGNAQQEGMEDDGATGVIRNFQIINSDGITGRAFAAFVKAFKVDPIAIDGVLRAKITLRASGAVTRI